MLGRTDNLRLQWLVSFISRRVAGRDCSRPAPQNDTCEFPRMPLKPFQRSVRRPYLHLPMDKEGAAAVGQSAESGFSPAGGGDWAKWGTPLCKHAAELRQQLALCHAYHNVVLLHASLRVPLPELGADARDSTIKHWQRDWPDRVWSLREARTRSSLTPNIDV